VTADVASDSVADDLATVLFAQDFEPLTTARMTRRITRAIGAWAIARGWAVKTEAPVAVAASETNRGQPGFVDVVIRRGGSAPDIAIEIDSADKPWSAVKLQYAAAAGMQAIWIRWGDNDWSGIYHDIDVIQLRIDRSPQRRSLGGQQSFWPDRCR
jgi:Uma2 family endonuclease